MAETWLIIGSDGTVGKALLGYLQRFTDIKAIGTTRRLPVSSHQLFLDLSDDLTEWQLPEDVQVVVNCAAIASLEACKRAPESSYRVNVQSVIELANKCHE